ncbi:transporter substrate-binding domain-containing protein [Paenibacillus allorhizosphaerae]|uniref:Glutamine-binding periplasmic protein n=1 Tax=Paenibacillus allorhizosphaerae TaxID=2849866 RepID=A0ABN7TN55_9BACL|nr:transporter substrate-binding domain-containing protein [Paenibacillus allorhizosphaerae]CAG7638578.1 Glutamine-binding periplasmic protein [Paenibacillus allorhizosphaerae]
MKRRMKQSFVMVAVTMLFLLTAACGSKADTSGSTGQTNPSNAGASASKDDVLQKIAGSKTLAVGLDATFKPFEYKSGDKFDGFDVDLIQTVAKELGADKVDFVDTEFKGLVPGLQAKKFDIIASAMYITDERKQTIDFSDTYFPGGLSIMVKKDNESIKGLQDLKGKKVSVQIGTKSVKFLEDNVKDVQLVKVEKNTEMFLELETGKVDAVVTGLPAAKTYTKEKGTTKVLPDTLTEEYYGYGIRKENAEFKNAVNAALKKVKDSGQYDQIVKKWFE